VAFANWSDSLKLPERIGSLGHFVSSPTSIHIAQQAISQLTTESALSNVSWLVGRCRMQLA
jgi:hypothetical protein